MLMDADVRDLNILNEVARLVQHRRKEMFYLTTHSTHFIYGYMASDIWLRTILIVRKETRCRHIGYSFRLTARVLLYAPSHIQDNTYHGLCYTSRGTLAGTRNSSMGPPHEGSIQRSIASWANALTTELLYNIEDASIETVPGILNSIPTDNFKTDSGYQQLLPMILLQWLVKLFHTGLTKAMLFVSKEGRKCFI